MFFSFSPACEFHRDHLILWFWWDPSNCNLGRSLVMNIIPIYRFTKICQHCDCAQGTVRWRGRRQMKVDILNQIFQTAVSSHSNKNVHLTNSDQRVRPLSRWAAADVCSPACFEMCTWKADNIKHLHLFCGSNKGTRGECTDPIYTLFAC